MKSLVSMWLEVELNRNGKTLAKAIAEMNQALKTKVTHSRIREWEENRDGRGTRLPQSVRSYLLYIVMPDAIGDMFAIEIDERMRRKLVRMLQ